MSDENLSNVEKNQENIETEKKNDVDPKDERIAKQSKELTFLTSSVIPNLKSEVKELKAVKVELSEALENSTKKYYEQLDINALLSDKLTKVSAEHAVSKVRLDKLDSTIERVKQEANEKVDKYKSKLSQVDTNEVTTLKDDNERLVNELKEREARIDDLEKQLPPLQSEVTELRNQLIDLGNYKDEVNAKNAREIEEYKETINNLKRDLNNKQSSYDKLSNETQKTISDLKNQVNKYKKALDEQSNRGLLDRLSNKPVSFDD